MKRLTPRVLDDDQALGEAIEKVLRDDAELRRIREVVLEHEEALRLVADPEVWQVFLLLDAVRGDLAAVTQETLVRWAFEEGRRAKA